jgi:hypothetical protein
VYDDEKLPLEEIKRRCEILARRIPQAKALGYRAGINVLSTMASSPAASALPLKVSGIGLEPAVTARSKLSPAL